MLSGILPVLPTPFSESAETAPEDLAQIVDFALRSGVDGVVFPGYMSRFRRQVEMIQGVRVVRVWTVSQSNQQGGEPSNVPEPARR